MNKPSVKPPKGWRWFEIGEMARAGDAVSGIVGDGLHKPEIIKRGENLVGDIEDGLCGNSSWYIRRVRRKPKRSLAEVLACNFYGHADGWKNADSMTQDIWSDIARAARRHIRQEGK